MAHSNTERSSTPSSNDKYDMEIDNRVLTQEEENMLTQIEQAFQKSAPSPRQPSKTSPGGSPVPKKRKRAPSASPHLTPSRLRSSVKPTARALDAGFKPNTTHIFRRRPSSRAASTELDTSTSTVAADTRRSESVDPLSMAASMAADTGRRSESTGPLMVPMLPSGFSHPTAMSMTGGDSQRSNSTGPGAPMHPGGFSHPDAMGDHLGHYRHYPIPQHYGAYPAPGQPHPHSMPPPFFQPPTSAYGNVQPPQFYPHANQFRDLKCLPADMPAEGPSSDVFSPHYIPAEPRRPLHASTLQPPAAQPASSTSTRSSTPACGVTTTRGPNPDHSVTSARHPTLSAEAADAIPKSTTEPSDASPPAIPSISMQPTTPTPPVHTDSNNPGRNEVSEHEDPVNIDGQLEESPTVGRISNAAREALRRGFSELDVAIKRISAETGLNPIQIVERWDVSRTRVASSWNIYQAFFEERRDQELARLEAEKQPPSGAVPDKSTVSACYKLFQAANPDTHDNILRAYHRLRQMSDRGELSISKRASAFRKHADKIDALIRSSSSIYGFESICITVGGVVNQDQNLAQIVGTDATVDFFLERFRSSDNLALAQMKAHVYDHLSKRIAVDDNESPRDPDAALMVKEESAASAIAGETPVPSIEILKNRLIGLAARYKITVTKGSALIWKGLPQAVAAAGCVFVNWPEDVPFPSDEAGKNNSKGISILKLPARVLLLAAFDHPTHPLILEKRYNTAVPDDQPVIVGIPPDANSPYTHARRKFLGAHRSEDRKGPARRKVASAPERKAVIQKHATLPSQKESPLSLTDENLDKDEDDKHGALPRASKKKPASKSKSKVQFVVPDDLDLEDPDTPYSASLDGSPKYSGSDDDMPVTRSPHLLRRKPSVKAKATGKQKAAAKPSSKKISRASTDEDEEEDHNDDAMVVEVDSDSTELTPKIDKKRRVQSAALNCPLATKQATSALKQSRAVDHSVTDRVAEMLFSDAPKDILPTKSATSKQPHAGDRSATDRAAEIVFSDAPAEHKELAVRARAAPHSRTSPSPVPVPAPPAPIPSAPAPHGNQPPPIPPRAHFPPHQPMDRNLQPPAPRREGYYAPGYPPPFPESYNGHYMHAEGPPSWNLAPGQGPPGWYAPPSTSDLQAVSGPGPIQHAGYWAHQGHPAYANPYAHYPPPNMHPTYPHQDETSRAASDAQAGPSRAGGDSQAGPSA